MGFGESAKLLDDRTFFKLLGEARKRLQEKLIEAKIPEKSLNVVRICIDHITILLQQSRYSLDQLFRYRCTFNFLISFSSPLKSFLTF